MQLSGKLQTIELVIGIKEAIIIDKTQELMCRALLIGEEYSKADKPIKIEVGEITTRSGVAEHNEKEGSWALTCLFPY